MTFFLKPLKMTKFLRGGGGTPSGESALIFLNLGRHHLLVKLRILIRIDRSSQVMQDIVQPKDRPIHIQKMTRSAVHVVLLHFRQLPVLLAQVLMWTYVVARAAHFVAYATAQLHDVRATFWTFSSLPVIVMAGYVLMQAV